MPFHGDVMYLLQILGYYMLIKYGPMREEQVDKAAEMFMQKKFDVDVDFEVADSLGKLVALGLVEMKDDGTYKCVPLDKACRKHFLDVTWICKIMVLLSTTPGA